MAAAADGRAGGVLWMLAEGPVSVGRGGIFNGPPKHRAQRESPKDGEPRAREGTGDARLFVGDGMKTLSLPASGRPEDQIALAEPGGQTKKKLSIFLAGRSAHCFFP